MDTNRALSRIHQTERINIAKHFDTKQFNKGDIVINQGDVAEVCYFIIEGVLCFMNSLNTISSSSSSSSSSAGNGSRIFRAGDVVGETCLQLNCKYPYSIRAESTTNVFVLRKENFQLLWKGKVSQ